MDWKAEFQQWVAEQPAHIQAMAREFPIASVFHQPDGMTAWLLGYTDAEELVLTCVNPHENYDAARDARFYLDVNVVRAAVAAARDINARRH